MSTAPEPKKPGRKPLPDGEGRTARYQGRTKPEWLVAWTAKAAGQDLTLSAWIEGLANKTAKR